MYFTHRYRVHYNDKDCGIVVNVCDTIVQAITIAECYNGLVLENMKYPSPAITDGDFSVVYKTEYFPETTTRYTVTECVRKIHQANGWKYLEDTYGIGALPEHKPPIWSE